MWLTLRRVTVLAALTDAGYFLLFWAIGSPVLQWINLVSIALYGLAWRLSRDRLHPASVWLMWIEVLGHAALGSLVIGWASGFHYFLMMFIPGIAASTRPRRAVPAIVLLLTFYIGLERLCSAVGPLQPVSPLSLDIVHALNVDHFKNINDTYGHAVGDEVLVSVAECLRACCRDHDVVARWGGEEFLLLLTRTDLAGGLVVAERIRGSIASQRLAASQPELSVTVSLGATQAQEGEALNEGIARADTALYRSKEAGRDRVTAV
jgi:diguanylate cyclase (GGDEF)-like protein